MTCFGATSTERFIFSMYLYAVKSLRINTITHKFLIRGHTQNEGDTAHSIIEKAIKRAKKSGPIYVPEQYLQIIRSAKKIGNPFKVKEMNYDDFYDLKNLTEEIGLNTTKDIQGNTIKTNDIKLIQFQKDGEIYKYKNGYDEDWIEVETKIVRARSKSPTKEIQNISLKPAYRSKIPIAIKKKTIYEN
ncbi:uncharacterized protein LOC106131153 [Amyelois transitella]|uniref:uncharacterized protein LOC106131153 n=1 Tax=Amyelois transitella TaxID=680683 RepID=UPI002990415A|nr:uncharacterized protein LOC106131153 [Amyelois transitella]